MSQFYEHPNQQLCELLLDIRAEARQTNNLLQLMLDALRNVSAGDPAKESQ